MALLDAARPAIDIGANPSSGSRRACDAVRPPCVARLRMFEDSADTPDGAERRCEAATVVTKHATNLGRGSATPVSSPSLTRRMRDHRMRTGVVPCVTLFVPRVHAWKVPVHATTFDEQGSNHSVPSMVVVLFAIGQSSIYQLRLLAQQVFWGGHN